MNERCIVNVATGRYVKGQLRLLSAVNGDVHKLFWSSKLPDDSPMHEQKPYAFKAYALRNAAQRFPLLLWCDASILPGPRGLEDLWDRIEERGYWFSRNGFRNSEWTNLDALADLGVSPEENETIEHVVATAFGVNVTHPLGFAFLDQYFRLASETRAFCGPWTGGKGVQHRHDQTAASVIAYKLGMGLTDPPEWFAYRGGETEKTALVADGAY